MNVSVAPVSTASSAVPPQPGSVHKGQATSPVQLNQQNLWNINTCISELNRRYAVVKFGGKAQVIDKQGEEISLMGFQDFQNLYKNIQVSDGTRYFPLGRYWINHPDRKQYLDGIAFDPSSRVSPGHFNLWQGFAVEPNSSKSCCAFLNHLHDVICSGNQEHFEYFLNWLAHMVQRPWELPGVAIVLLSPQGTGKGLLMKYLGRIFGCHYKHLSGRSHLVGKYTGHLHDAVLVFADELSWNNSKEDAGTLKSMITEPTRMMEKKFADAVPVRNCTHLIVASNEDHVVPAEISDRRYFILDVASTKRGNEAYFSKLAAELDADGPGALLHLLLKRDVSGFSPGKFPKTKARINQQILSLSPVYAWLQEQLEHGCLQCIETSPEVWPERVAKDAVYENYCTWHTRRQCRQPVSSLKTFTSTLKKLGVGTCKVALSAGGNRVAGYRLPPLAAMRKSFEDILGGEINWEWADVV